MGCPRFAGKDWNGFIEEDLGDVLSESFRVGEVGVVNGDEEGAGYFE